MLACLQGTLITQDVFVGIFFAVGPLFAKSSIQEPGKLSFVCSGYSLASGYAEEVHRAVSPQQKAAADLQKEAAPHGMSP
eukprot:1160803-Pelagomonas_calceolata.AAC.6